MKLTCMAQMYNENTHKGHDGLTNLARFIESIAKYCDALVMYDDASTDNSVQALEAMQEKLDAIEYFAPCGSPYRLREIHVIKGKKNQFNQEMAHKAEALERAKQILSNWILWLDVDEVIEARGEQGAVRELCEGANKGAFNLFNRNLWRTDRYYRTDELWNVGLFCRLWKVTDALHYEPKSGLHNDLVPKGINGRETNDLRVIHYGFASNQNILRKYHTYKAHGQKGRALDRLIDESSIKLAAAKPEWFNDPSWPYGPKVLSGCLRQKI
jgi:glycosyltransferase involved in cell wall biosynthesis